MDALASQADMTRFGYTPPVNADALLDRASARIRLAAGHQIIDFGQSTVTFPPPPTGKLSLWQTPVVGIVSVTLDDGQTVDDYELVGNDLFLPRSQPGYGFGYIGSYDSWRYHDITVTYSHGYAVLPDELVELVCSVAIRLGGTKPDRDPAVQAQTVGDVSQTLNPALTNVAGLLPGEEATLRRIFYRRG